MIEHTAGERQARYEDFQQADKDSARLLLEECMQRIEALYNISIMNPGTEAEKEKAINALFARKRELESVINRE